MTVAEALKWWRTVRGLTQWELAEKCRKKKFCKGEKPVGYASIARIETGGQDPSVGMLERLAVALEIDVVDFFRVSRRPAPRRARGK